MIYLKNFLVEIKNGKLVFHNAYHEALYRKFLKQFEGKKGWITFEPKIGIRTERQNRFYWLYLGMISHSHGHTPMEIHEWAKNKFLKDEEKIILGEKVSLTKSTTTLNKLEFGEYIDKICEATGITPPDPSIWDLAPLK